jgi:hypothetical protein
MTLPEAVDSIEHYPWFYQWVTNCFQPDPAWFHSSERVSSLLGDPFDWTETPEGDSFWDNLDNLHLIYFDEIPHEDFFAYLHERFPSDKFPELYV